MYIYFRAETKSGLILIQLYETISHESDLLKFIHLKYIYNIPYLQKIPLVSFLSCKIKVYHLAQ